MTDTLKVVETPVAPEAFAIPSATVVDLFKLLGELPCRVAARHYLALQELKPIEPTIEPE